MEEQELIVLRGTVPISILIMLELGRRQNKKQSKHGTIEQVNRMLKPIKVHPIKSESIILWGDDGNKEHKLIAERTCEVTTMKDDTISRQAVKHLDLFTKTYCRDKSVTDDLVFRCNQCDFQLSSGTCLVKTMARKLCPDYREFGSMGDL